MNNITKLHLTYLLRLVDDYIIIPKSYSKLTPIVFQVWFINVHMFAFFISTHDELVTVNSHKNNELKLHVYKWILVNRNH